MKTYTAIAVVIISAVGSALITLQLDKPRPREDSAEPDQHTRQDSEKLGDKLDWLGAQLERTNLTLAQLASTMSSQPAKEEPAWMAVPAPGAGTEGASAVPREKVMFVNPTAQQNEDYEVLNAQLDDAVFLADLNLQSFSRSVEMQSLPKPLQMVLIQKAIAKYNSGNVSTETFLGSAPPAYR